MLVAGARPNLIKVTPIICVLSARGSIRATLVHTGQNRDDAMSGSFFGLRGDGLQCDHSIQFPVQTEPGGLEQSFIIGRAFVGDRPSALTVFHGAWTFTPDN